MLLRAIALTGKPRMRAIGFVALGGGYLLLMFSSFFSLQQHLWTTYAIAWMAKTGDIIPQQTSIPAPGMGGGGGFFSVPTEISVSIAQMQQFGFVSPENVAAASPIDDVMTLANTGQPHVQALNRFFIIGQCVWSWLLGLLGGQVTVMLSNRRKRGHCTLLT